MSDPYLYEVELEVMGAKISVSTAALRIGDLDADMAQVAAQMSFFGMRWAEAEGEKIEADSSYRNWRASQSEAILAKDPKLAEWKVKQGVEAMQGFVGYKKAIAEATKNAIMLRAVFESYGKKAPILQSKGARQRAELSATDIHTKAETKAPDDLKRDAEAVRKTLKGKKGRK